MSDPACANCKFGLRIKLSYGEVVVCQRYPPHPVAVLGEKLQPGGTIEGYWPRTGLSDKCGEHQFADKKGESIMA
jgi:hypothetical protein